MVPMRRTAYRRVFELLRRAMSDTGANVVEMALVSMFLLVLIGGMVDLGGAFQNYIIITNAAREGARTAARLPCHRTGGSDDNTVAISNAIRQAVVDEAAGSNLALDGSQVTIIPDPITTACPVAGEPYEIRVEIQYQTLLGSLWGANQFPVGNSAIMAFSGNDQ